MLTATLLLTLSAIASGPADPSTRTTNPAEELRDLTATKERLESELKRLRATTPKSEPLARLEHLARDRMYLAKDAARRQIARAASKEDGARAAVVQDALRQYRVADVEYLRMLVKGYSANPPLTEAGVDELLRVPGGPAGGR